MAARQPKTLQRLPKRDILPQPKPRRGEHFQRFRRTVMTPFSDIARRHQLQCKGNGSIQTATWNSQLGPKLESQYQAGTMNCGGQEKGTLPSQYCHKIMTLSFYRKITFL